jgi:hypothetical protein
MMEDRHKKEKRAVKEEIRKVKNDNRLQKVSVAYMQHGVVLSGPFICGVAYCRIM